MDVLRIRLVWVARWAGHCKLQIELWVAGTGRKVNLSYSLHNKGLRNPWCHPGDWTLRHSRNQWPQTFESLGSEGIKAQHIFIRGPSSKAPARAVNLLLEWLNYFKDTEVWDCAVDVWDSVMGKVGEPMRKPGLTASVGSVGSQTCGVTGTTCCQETLITAQVGQVWLLHCWTGKFPLQQ